LHTHFTQVQQYSQLGTVWSQCK